MGVVRRIATPRRSNAHATPALTSRRCNMDPHRTSYTGLMKYEFQAFVDSRCTSFLSQVIFAKLALDSHLGEHHRREHFDWHPLQGAELTLQSDYEPVALKCCRQPEGGRLDERLLYDDCGNG
jgi:hypothetical protein